MAQKQYTAKLGDDKTKVVKGAGSAIGTNAIQVTIDTANCTSKEEALKLLELVEARITEDTWPPA